MNYGSGKLLSTTSLTVSNDRNIESGLNRIWMDVRNNVNGILGIGLVSRIGFPISSSFISSEIDDDKCAAMVASVITVADRIGLEFTTIGTFKQSIFTNSEGFLLFYDIGYDSLLFCIARTESTRLGLVNYVIQQKMPQIKSFLE